MNVCDYSAHLQQVLVAEEDLCGARYEAWQQASAPVLRELARSHVRQLHAVACGRAQGLVWIGRGQPDPGQWQRLALP